ncbi:hypothetical protein FA13DRAFT_270389 [Coprinellus micaceus]|uniref:DUF6534 domain-containing protein n=1 Tax=Coprinellus micaceus TaxID=71717 RepID=A0A4Y7SEI6_COPMI|nr:hypothetical protein FA13DRAFT_270389 [Coprinellus micaceus]
MLPKRYFHDKWLYKILVGALWIAECIDVVFVGYSVYHYTITHFGDFQYFMTEDIIWSLILQVLVAAMVGVVVKCTFVVRVWTFSKHNYYITGIIAALILGQTGLALAYCVKAFEFRKIEAAPRLRGIATWSLSAGVVTDLAIALALCYFLRKLRTGFKKSDSLVNMLCVYAINTGILTSAVSATVLALYNVYPNFMYFMGAYFVLGNLYAISFICTLNTRRAIRGKGTDNQASTTDKSRGGAIYMITNPSGHRAQAPANASNVMTTTKQNLEIDVRQEISVLTDIESGRTTKERL